ncbi:MAG: DUF4350 domain-containing protein [Candidatus Poseidoniaceae archaeon]|nr:DUF4350 domain-containing protein [Candidatus Poseidoniaceae archaeon]MBL6889465.1 DUF4350 domain-containing protein [Candidatus Poseidoniaceae archaeon]
MAAERARNLNRIGLQVAFWAVLGILLLTVLQNFINISQSEQLSAYDDDWNDMSAFREDINDMGVETRSLVSSPLLLADIEDPRNTTFVVAGVERDTLSFPQFDEDGFITIATEDGYSPSEVDAIVEFVDNGGTVIVLEDFGYAGSIGEAYGVRYSGYQLQDTNYVAELDYNYIWMCMQASPCGMNGTTLDPTTIDQHERWSDVTGPHPCSELDGESMTLKEAGLCSHHWVKSSGELGRIEYNATYTMLLNNVTGLEIVPGVKGALNDVNVRAVTSNQATVDVNGDGYLWIGNEQTSETPDLSGQFNLSIEACASSSCDPDEGGRVFFIADGSSLINAIYDYEGFNEGKYGEQSKDMPANDNRKWALDVISESLMSTKDGETGQPAENAMVIFDESRHPQNALLADSYNTVYFLLVYFTGEGLAMLALFVVLFITFEGVLLKKRDPEPWRHIFSIIYYGFGDANRYTYYAKTEKIRQVFLSKVRNQNGLTRDEFHAMSAKELVGLIEDPVLAKFAIEPGKYSLEQSVALVKRIKAWGRR